MGVRILPGSLYIPQLLCEVFLIFLLKNKVRDLRKNQKLTREELAELIGISRQAINAIEKETNVRPQIWAASSIADVFENLKIPFERTEKTQAPSFTKNFLQEHKHPVVNMIAKAREVNKAHTTFIDSILRYEYKGRIQDIFQSTFS